MLITTKYVDIPADKSPMRMFVAAPKQEGKYPGIVFYSDIFQLTGPMIRATMRLAGYGFVVAAPEIYHRIEPAGTAIPFDDEGRTRGLSGAAQTSVTEFDDDCRSVLDYLDRHPSVKKGKLGAGGFCIGGHLAFRAALQHDVLATACFYGTGIHNGKLGKDGDSRSLERASELRGELLLVFGTLDPHVPAEGRERIRAALNVAGANYSITLYPAEHASMRDEGPRYDPEVTDQAWAEMIQFFRRVL